MKNKLRIAIQKSGRLSEKSSALLNECGFDIRSGKSSLMASAANFPIDVLYLRDDDIPEYVADGTADLGILGENVVIESGVQIDTVMRLDFGRCRLCLAVPKNVKYSGPEFFQGKKIATSYPNILNNYLAEKNIQADVHLISGSVEIAPTIGLAAGIFDIVSSGGTLFSNGLVEVETVLKSEAVLVAHKNLSKDRRELLNKIVFRLNAVMAAQKNKYVVMNVPNEAIEKVSAILPGMKSPTVVPLATSGWSAIHSVLNENKFWEVIDDLKAVGAQGILVVPIEKLIL